MGSAVVLHGSTWHGGGGNDHSSDDQERYGLSIQYVAGLVPAAAEPDAGYAARAGRDVSAAHCRSCIGYSIYRNVMGHVDRQHPLKLLGADVEPEHGLGEARC